MTAFAPHNHISLLVTSNSFRVMEWLKGKILLGECWVAAAGAKKLHRLDSESSVAGNTKSPEVSWEILEEMHAHRTLQLSLGSSLPFVEEEMKWSMDMQCFKDWLCILHARNIKHTRKRRTYSALLFYHLHVNGALHWVNFSFIYIKLFSSVTKL